MSLPIFDHEALPVGKTPADQQRNAALLSEYEYDKYVMSLTGYTGQDLQRIAFVRWQDAIRVRVGPRGNYKAGMAQMADGRLIAAVCRDNARPDPTQRYFDIFLYESTDLGLSWRAMEHTPLLGKEPSLTALPDSALLFTAQNGYFGPGAANDSIYMARSEDGGRTWQVVNHPGNDYPRNVIIERDGSLTMVRALQNDWTGRGGGSPHLEVARSTDGGRTWRASIGHIPWDYSAFGEISTIRLRDGRLLAALRRQMPGTEGEGFEDTVLSESLDDGQTWSAPWRMSQTAEVHTYLIELGDGRLLATYSNYHLPWGICAMISADGGRTWDHDHTIQLALSASYSVGWPVTLQLTDGSFITSYAATTYIEQAPGHVTCETVRWRLPE